MQTYFDVLNVFHSMPLTKYEFPEALEMQFFLNALAEYELDVGDLQYDLTTQEFKASIPSYTVYTLGLMMYICSLVRELSRVMKLNAITGRDVSLTGMDATKRVTKQELEDELNRAQTLLHKQKKHAFDN